MGQAGTERFAMGPDLGERSALMPPAHNKPCCSFSVAGAPQAIGILARALARARVEGQPTMIEADALACTRDEIDALFAQRGVDASVTQTDSVHQRTLGWPAAAV